MIYINAILGTIVPARSELFCLEREISPTTNVHVKNAAAQTKGDIPKMAAAVVLITSWPRGLITVRLLDLITARTMVDVSHMMLIATAAVPRWTRTVSGLGSLLRTDEVGCFVEEDILALFFGGSWLEGETI